MRKSHSKDNEPRNSGCHHKKACNDLCLSRNFGGKHKTEEAQKENMDFYFFLAYNKGIFKSIMDNQILQKLISNSFILSSQKKKYFLRNISIIPKTILEKLFSILKKEHETFIKSSKKAEKKLLSDFHKTK